MTDSPEIDTAIKNIAQSISGDRAAWSDAVKSVIGYAGLVAVPVGMDSRSLLLDATVGAVLASYDGDMSKESIAEAFENIRQNIAELERTAAENIAKFGRVT